MDTIKSLVVREMVFDCKILLLLSVKCNDGEIRVGIFMLQDKVFEMFKEYSIVANINPDGTWLPYWHTLCAMDKSTEWLEKMWCYIRPMLEEIGYKSCEDNECPFI